MKVSTIIIIGLAILCVCLIIGAVSISSENGILSSEIDRLKKEVQEAKAYTKNAQTSESQAKRVQQELQNSFDQIKLQNRNLIEQLQRLKNKPQEEAKSLEVQKSDVVNQEVVQSKTNISIQEEFHRERAKFWEEFQKADTEIRQSDVFNRTAQYTSKFFQEQNYYINGWRGVLKSISTSHAATNTTVSITATYAGFKIDFYSKNILRDTKLYKQLLTTREGQNVVFCGVVTSDDDKGIRESSWTEKGNVSAPAFSIQLVDIKPD